jgi:hypothetical protein
MSELLDRYVEKNILQRKSSWYYIGKEIFSRSDKAEARLDEMIKSGEIVDLRDNKDLENVNNIIEPSKPETEGLKPFNPALTNLEDPTENFNIDELFSPLAANIGDISTRQQGGRFRVYVFGVDSRHSKHPSIQKCPYVFRHNDKKRNVRSGKTIYNEGWTVLSKKLIAIDPRTNKPWLTVSRDDTPDEDFFTVCNSVLCYADKKQFDTKKFKMDRANDIRAGVVSDKRQEIASAMATISKTDPVKSMQGFVNTNKLDQGIIKEQLETSGFTKQKADEYINRMNSIGSGESVDSDVEKLQQSLLENNVKSMQVNKLSINDI